jgi:hypothetical protein
MKGKLGVGSTEYGNKVISECADSSLGGVATMHVGRYKLKINVLFANGAFESCRCFVVEFLQLWFEALFDKVPV